MSRLTVWDATTKEEILRTEDADTIAATLKEVGVRFERWPVAPLPKGAPADAVLAAYKPNLDAFLAETAAGTADVIQLTPAWMAVASVHAPIGRWLAGGFGQRQVG
jgi:1,2-dihydroxy-3-keto-5-methylthiopentene dioxygenase